MDESQKQALIKTYRYIRSQTENICKPLLIEDYVIQSMEDVSPPKWHLAHTTWFFETFILKVHQPHYQFYNPVFAYLYNSYYYQLGKVFPRTQRGSLSRPSVEETFAYRQHVDNVFIEFINSLSESQLQNLNHLIELGLHHEQQHQELLLMDIKYNFSVDVTYPSYQQEVSSEKTSDIKKLEFIFLEENITEIGHKLTTFSFDNEKPSHKQIVHAFQIANRLTTNGEFLEFIEAGGYQDACWWLSNGWEAVQRNRWEAPLYWQKINNEWYEFTLGGLKKLDLAKPVTHVSYYEADAFSRWRKKRLATEIEWEYAVKKLSPKMEGNFLENKILHPTHASKSQSVEQFYGDVWEWTCSAYLPYPGFKPYDAKLSEYNGKFMDNQMILRGGSCITPQSHIRPTYRNYFPPDKRWFFGGIRLASDV